MLFRLNADGNRLLPAAIDLVDHLSRLLMRLSCGYDFCSLRSSRQKQPLRDRSSHFIARDWRRCRAGDLANARAAFEQVVKLAPGSAEGHNLLGWVLFSQGQTAEAITQFKTALRLKPDLAAAHVNLANALVKNGALAEAESEARTAVAPVCPTTPRRTELWEKSPAFALTRRRPPQN